jgi:hypothetical protein
MRYGHRKRKSYPSLRPGALRYQTIYAQVKIAGDAGGHAQIKLVITPYPQEQPQILPYQMASPGLNSYHPSDKWACLE